ncbi:DgyrCDS14923 [Dimorphilus gyrociliatus]|uniref:DgyrCDS14923 n=1 Tax=Dimorphilus gyrociliatus TaxID=2664684 RepID=A0A7I8WFF5_9ANNE|nr:DgyrCDS14923 [Dimorphilus gyrociliatus]
MVLRLIFEWKFEKFEEINLSDSHRTDQGRNFLEEIFIEMFSQCVYFHRLFTVEKRKNLYLFIELRMYQRINSVFLLLVLANGVEFQQIYIDKSMCQTFVGQVNRKYLGMKGLRITPNLDRKSCLESCINDKVCSSVEYNELTKDCRKKDYGSYKKYTEEELHTFLYTKIPNPDCQNWKRTDNNHLIYHCDPCVIQNLPINNLEACEQKCSENSGCYAVNKAEHCHLLGSISVPDAMLTSGKTVNSHKPMCLALFNISTEHICINYLEKSWIDSLGDGITECPARQIMVPLKATTKINAQVLLFQTTGMKRTICVN